MFNSKLIALLKTFSSSELRAFKDFVASPFFNKNQELVRFYLYLKKTAPEFSSKKLARQQVFRTLYPGQPYDDKQLNYLMSFLLKLAEQYLGWTKYQTNGVLPQCDVLAACLDRQLDKHYQNIYQKTQQKLEAQPWRDAAFFYQRLRLSDLAERHFNQQKVRRSDPNLQDAADHLDRFYLHTQLKYACEMLDRQKTLSVQYQLGLIEAVQPYLEENGDLNSPGIAIYYRIFLTLTAPKSEQHFEQLKGLLQSHRNAFSTFEMKEMYLMALNYCIRKVRKNDKQYVKEAFDLFRQGIEERLLYENDRLSPWTFKNTIKLGLRLRQFEWTEQFIRHYKDDLEEGIRENALHFNLADLHYYRRDYEQALDYLQRVEYSDVFYALSSKVVLLKIYFETREMEALHSLVASFRVYLHRNKLISANVRQTYLNFISLLHQLLKPEERQAENLRDKIIHTEPLTDRTWLLQQLEG